MDETLWVVIDVGCHECGVGSVVVGAYLTEADAFAAADERQRQTDGWRGGGQTIAKVFAVPLPVGVRE